MCPCLTVIDLNLIIITQSVLLLDDTGCPVSKPILKYQAVAIARGTFACNTFDNRIKESPEGKGKELG